MESQKITDRAVFTTSPHTPATPIRAWVTLVLFAALYILAFLDRFILALLITPLKATFHLSDFQMGLLFGTFFAFCYATFGLPLAMLADRWHRKTLLILGVLLWSSCTMGSGLTHSYVSLAMLRIGVAIGEAVLVPTALSMLTDYFPPHRRILAGTLFTGAGMAGASTAFLIGSFLIGWIGKCSCGGLEVWRIVFFMVGAPGFVLAFLVLLIAREPQRSASAVITARLSEIILFVRNNARLYGGLFLGAGAAQMISYTLIAWAPSFLERQYGLSIAASGKHLGIMQIFSGLGGTLVLPTLFRQLALKWPRASVTMPAIGSGTGALLAAISVLTHSELAFLSISLVGGFFLIGSTNTIVILLQPLAPPAMRATLTALLLACITGFGLGFGPPLAALISGSHRPLSFGLFGVASIGFVFTTFFFLSARKPLQAAIQAARIQ